MSRLGKFLFLGAAIALICMVIIYFLLGSWVPFCWLALGIFTGCIVGAVYVDHILFSQFLTMKTTKQGMSMGAMIALVLVLIAAVNFIAARKYVTWDLSLNKVNTLSDQSIKLIDSLSDDLRVMYFYKEGTEGVEQNRRLFVDLIRKYQDKSARVKLDFVEVNQHPDLTEKYKISKGTQAVLLEYKGRTSLIEKIDEQELTSALVKVTREQEKKVYFLSGHGEMGFEASQDGHSLSILKQLLEANRYTVSAFSLTTAPAVPTDADLVVIAGPVQSFIEVEIQALDDYLKHGGGVILAVKPKANHHLESWLAKWGLSLGGDYITTVLDTQMGRAVDPRYTRGSVFSTQHQITKPFGKSEFTVFHLPQALIKGQVPEGTTLEEMVKTNETSMSFKDTGFKSEGEKGPFTLAVEIKSAPNDKNVKGFSLLVFGDSDFMNDQYLYQNLNRDLVLNSVAYLAKEENLISITPKEIQATQLVMSETQFILFIFGFIIPLPLLLFTSSGILWFRRRHA